MVFFLDEDGSFLDDVEGISIISLIENNLSLLVGLGKAGGGQCVFLFLGEFLEEGKDF